MASEEPITADIDLYLTGACHSRCKFCYTKRLMKGDEELSFDEFKGIIDQLARLPLSKDFSINFGGAEPFRHPKIREMLKYASDKLPHVSLWAATNLFWLSRNPQRAREQLKSIPENINFTVSLDPEHEKYIAGLTERIKNLIPLLEERGAKWHITSVISLWGGFGLKKLLSELGAKFRGNEITISGSWGTFDLRRANARKSRITKATRNMEWHIDDTISKISRGKACNAVQVLPDGRVLEAYDVDSLFGLPELRLGNWKDEPFGKIIEEIPARRRAILDKLRTGGQILADKMHKAARTLRKKFRRRPPATPVIKR